MTIRVLVVDDSAFFRRTLGRILDSAPDLEVAGTAENGREAVRLAAELKPDVITMDVEMPVMDGISAVREIMRDRPTPILMLSALTVDGAAATMDALGAGAVDFIPKRIGGSGGVTGLRDQLIEKIRGLGSRRAVTARRSFPTPARPAVTPKTARADKVPARDSGRIPRDARLVVIGASTGGPAAVQTVLAGLPADFPLPVLVIQHMPAMFTEAFANRLDRTLAVRAREVSDGESLEPGCVYVAPGGRHTLVEGSGGRFRARLEEAGDNDHYRPSVDKAFASAAREANSHVLGVVLTGMGADGKEGAAMLKRAGSCIWAQDEATSVVYGMPAAVADLAHSILSLTDISRRLGG